jgi:gliding motility-associated lipoprotein GldH
MAVIGIQLLACAKIDVYEKNVSLKNHEWPGNLKPSVSFIVTDTTSLYNLYVVLRHSDAYNYNNLWINVYTKSPGDTTIKQPLDLQLANKEGWLGTGMDDIFEHRIRINNAPVQLKKPGEYVFTFENIMREDPLKHVLNIGFRIEKSN